MMKKTTLALLCIANSLLGLAALTPVLADDPTPPYDLFNANGELAEYELTGIAPWANFRGRYFIDTTTTPAIAWVLQSCTYRAAYYECPGRDGIANAVVKVPLQPGAPVEARHEMNTTLPSDGGIDLSHGSPTLAQTSDGTLFGAGRPFGPQHGMVAIRNDAREIIGYEPRTYWWENQGTCILSPPDDPERYGYGSQYGYLFRVDKDTLTTQQLTLKNTAGGRPDPICPVSEIAVDSEDGLWFFSHIIGEQRHYDNNVIPVEYRGQKLYRAIPPAKVNGVIPANGEWTLQLMLDNDSFNAATTPTAWAQTRAPSRLFFSEDYRQLFVADAQGGQQGYGQIYRISVTWYADRVEVGNFTVMHHMNGQGSPFYNSTLDISMGRVLPALEFGDYIYGAFGRSRDPNGNETSWRYDNNDLYSGVLWRIRKDAAVDAEGNSSLEVFYTFPMTGEGNIVSARPAGPMVKTGNYIYATSNVRAASTNRNLGLIFRIGHHEDKEAITVEPVFLFDENETGKYPMGLFASADGKTLYTSTNTLDANQNTEPAFLAIDTEQLQSVGTGVFSIRRFDVDQISHLLPFNDASASVSYTLSWETTGMNACTVYETHSSNSLDTDSLAGGERVSLAQLTDQADMDNGSLVITRATTGTYRYLLDCQSEFSEQPFQSTRNVMVAYRCPSDATPCQADFDNSNSSGSAFGIGLLLPIGLLAVLGLRRRAAITRLQGE